MADTRLMTRVESLEARLMYQEAALEELTASMLLQEKIIRQQSGAIERLEKLLRALETSKPATPGEETPPPHY